MKEKSFIDCGKDNYPEESNFFEELILLLAKYNVNITIRYGDGYDKNTSIGFEFKNSVFASDYCDIYPYDPNEFINDYNNKDVIRINPIPYDTFNKNNNFE